MTTVQTHTDPTEGFSGVEVQIDVMAQSFFMTCPGTDCEEPVAINAAHLEGGILNVEFECPGCGMEDTLRHENPNSE